MDPQVFVFIGRAGCGKGTQAELLVTYLKEKGNRTVLYIEMGKSLREFATSSSTHTADLTQGVLKKGGLLPAFMPVWVWSSKLIDGFSGEEHVVLEGAPRRLQDAMMLESAFEFYGLQRPHIIYLDVSNGWSRERLMERKRGDDAPTEIEKRLSWFDTDVLPIIEYYKNNREQDLHVINGEQTIEEVHADVVKAIESR